MTDARVDAGMRAMLAARAELLAAGARPLGWKVGFNVHAIRERLELDRPLVGFLTDAGLLQDGATWPLDDGGVAIAECEVAVELGADVPPGASREEALTAIAALLPAIEVADPPDLSLGVERILAGNIFHRAVRFGPRADTAVPGTGRILVNGEEAHPLAAADTEGHLAEMVRVVADRLAEAGERLRAGDRIITGVLAPPHAAHRGDTVRLELDELGGVELAFSS